MLLMIDLFEFCGFLVSMRFFLRDFFLYFLLSVRALLNSLVVAVPAYLRF